MSQEPFDIPLFREIQKILASSQGPLNFELARQLATAIATEGVAEAPVAAEERRAFSDPVHAAELLLSGYSRLTLDEPVGLEVVSRAWWVNATLKGWQWLLAAVAQKFAGELGRLGAGDEAQPSPMQAGLQQITPLLVGMQAGTLIGHLAKDSLDRYDIPIPREDGPHLFFVVANIDAVAADYRFPLDDFRRWLALHSVSRHLVNTAVPWVPRYFRGLLLDLVDSVQVDTGDLERRLLEIQTKGMEGFQEALGEERTIPLVQSERHASSLSRLRAFLAAYEGYATHISSTVAPELVQAAGQIDEGMARRNASPSEGKLFLANVLGVSVDRALESAGATFCAAVVKLKGMGALNHVWRAPDNLPSVDEIKDPFAWMERVLENQ